MTVTAEYLASQAAASHAFCIPSRHGNILSLSVSGFTFKLPLVHCEDSFRSLQVITPLSELLTVPLADASLILSNLDASPFLLSDLQHISLPGVSLAQLHAIAWTFGVALLTPAHVLRIPFTDSLAAQYLAAMKKPANPRVS